MLTHLVWHDEDPDPRVLQTAFTVTLLVVLAAQVLGGRAVGLLSPPVVGVLLAALAAGAVLRRPTLTDRPLVRTLVPVLDIGATALLGTGPGADSALPLVVLPALWLGLDRGLRGAAIALGATFSFLAVPLLVTEGVAGAGAARLLTLPLLAGVGASAITTAQVSARAAQARAEVRESELAHALSVIERNRRQAEAVFTAVDVGLLLLGSDRVPLQMNRRLEGMVDLAYPGGPGDRSEGWVFAADGKTPLAYDETPTTRAILGEEFDDVRVWIGPDPATRRALSVSARRVTQDDGSIGGAAVSYTDVTDYMQALRVKDDFIALVSHELRTPLTPITGYCDVLLERDDLPPAVVRQLRAIERSAQRMGALVDQLLLSSQIVQGGVDLDRHPVDLAALIAEVVATARPDAERAGIRLEADLGAGLSALVDPHLLTQAVRHLVGNGLKFTPERGSVTIGLRGRGPWVELSVADTGIGIQDADLDRLCTPFFRTAEASARAIQGVGLGLTITRSIVESHGGTVRVSSRLGVGSTFVVALPAAAAA